MSILQALNRAYDLMASRNEVPGFGFSNQNISFVISLNPDGSLAGAPVDLRDDTKTSLLDQNVVFTLESDRLSSTYLHDRPASRQVWANLTVENEGTKAICLVTGKNAPVQQLHPAIKGVWGGQTGGGSIVSFNLESSESYGHEQGDNAPVSESAAFAYTTVLNKLLEKGSQSRIQIGDASTVFWAEAPEPEISEEAETLFHVLFAGVNETVEAHQKIKLADRLVLSLVNRRQLRANDFITSDGGAVTLTDDARKLVLTAWQERKKEEKRHPFIEENAPLGLVPFLQAQLMARHLRGDLDAYPPWFWK